MHRHLSSVRGLTLVAVIAILTSFVSPVSAQEAPPPTPASTTVPLAPVAPVAPVVPDPVYASDPPPPPGNLMPTPAPGFTLPTPPAATALPLPTPPAPVDPTAIPAPPATAPAPVAPTPIATAQPAPIVTTTAPPMPGLTFDIAIEPETTVGDTIPFTITLINRATSPGEDVVVTLPVPDGALAQDRQATKGAKGGWQWNVGHIDGPGSHTLTGMLRVVTQPADGILVLEPQATARNLPTPAQGLGGSWVGRRGGNAAKFTPGSAATIRSQDGQIEVTCPSRHPSVICKSSSAGMLTR